MPTRTEVIRPPAALFLAQALVLALAFGFGCGGDDLPGVDPAPPDLTPEPPPAATDPRSRKPVPEVTPLPPGSLKQKG